MPAVFDFVLDDTSPLITFSPTPSISPVPDQNNPPINQGWQTQFNGRFLPLQNSFGLGNQTSTHITSLVGASLSFSFVGTAINLVGNSTQSTYDIVLDGRTTTGLSANTSATNQTLFFADNLPQTTHTLSLIYRGSNDSTSTSFISVDKALIQAVAETEPSTSTIINSTSLAFTGSWTFMQQSLPLFSDPSLLKFHQSVTAGDQVVFRFDSEPSAQPVYISVLGIVDSQSGLYNVTLSSGLNGTSASTNSGNFGWTAGTELFVASGLGTAPQNLTLTVTNLENKPLRIAAINVTEVPQSASESSSISSTPSSSSSASTGTLSPSSAISNNRLSPGTIVALVLSSICFAALILICIFVILLRRRRRQRRSQSNDDVGGTGVKEKAESRESVLDIGQPLPPRRIERSVSTPESFGDLFGPIPTRSLRRSRGLSLPRTASVPPVGNGGGGGSGGGGGGGPGFSEPYSNYTYMGPTLRAVEHSPFVFSFDTASRSQPDSKPASSRKEYSNTSSSGRESYHQKVLKERSSAMLKLTSGAGAVTSREAKSNFLDLNNSKPQIDEEGGVTSTEQGLPTTERDRPLPMDIPTAVSPGETPLEGVSRDASDTSGVNRPFQRDRLSPVFIPAVQASRQGSRSRSELQTPITLSSSDLDSELRPRMYGYAYQPSVTAASRSTSPNDPESRRMSEGTQRSSTRDVPLLHAYGVPPLPSHLTSEADPHPYARPSTSEDDEQRDSFQVQLTPVTPASNETEMVFSRPESQEVERLRRRPPGIDQQREGGIL